MRFRRLRSAALGLTVVASLAIFGALIGYAQTPPYPGVLMPGSGGAAARVLPLTSGQIAIGQGTAADPLALAPTGDVTLSAAGVTTVGGIAGHVKVGTATAPALTSCGTGSPTISGDDKAGQVTMGTSATGCVITFNTAYTSAPYCVVTWIATPLASQSYAVVAASITLTQTLTSGNKANYFCMAQSGG